MKLVVVEGSFAVCRLPPDSQPPPWVFDGSSSSSSSSSGNNPTSDCSFSYSITKTSDELSIVCREDIIPSAVSEQQQHQLITIEKGWNCMKVVGPLDFNLTGILSRLASPLAAAGVSIFAISTYDTDYLLIKCQQIDKAIEILQREGHSVIVIDSGDGEKAGDKEGGTAATGDGREGEGTAGVGKPRDGPAHTFEADPLVAILVDEQNKEKEECFGIGLIAGWPPNKYRIEQPYQEFVNAVQQCWDECDYQYSRTLSLTQPPPVYFYPYKALHVTAAIMVRPRPISHLIENGGDNIEIQNKLIHVWKTLMEKATLRPEWPTKPLSLEIEHAQIGQKAGILLWNETTGGMRAIRHCIQKVFQQERQSSNNNIFEEAGIPSNLIGIDIPPIVHSTFLRYYEVPKTPGHIVQERFTERVMKHLHDFFPDPISVPVIKLVCERVPYMHISHNSDTVLATSFLLQSTSTDDDGDPSSSSSQDMPPQYTTDCNEAEDILNRIHNKDK